MLKHNTTLSKLDMCYNLVSEKGALAMAEMLRHNTILRQLHISWDSVGERRIVSKIEDCTVSVIYITGISW